MKCAGSTILFLLLLSSAWGQSTIPGTFNTPNQTPTAVMAPLLSPPIVSYGAGANGAPAIINGQPAGTNTSSAAVESASVSQGYVNAAGYVPMPRPAIVSGQISAMASQRAQTAAPAAFDFVIAPGSGQTGEISSAGVGDTSLGQLAASLRKGPPPTQRKFSNEDIARLNGNTNNTSPMPGASTDQPPYPQQPQTPPHSDLGSAPLPPGAKPSPFSPKPVASANPVTGTDSAQSEPTQLAQNTVPHQPAAQPAEEPTAGQESEPSAPSSATASAQRQLPASGSLLPFFAMLGGAAAITGYVLSKRR